MILSLVGLKFIRAEDDPVISSTVGGECNSLWNIYNFNGDIRYFFGQIAYICKLVVAVHFIAMGNQSHVYRKISAFCQNSCSALLLCILLLSDALYMGNFIRKAR